MKINPFATYAVLIASALVLSPSRLGVDAGTVRGVHKTIDEDRTVQPESHAYFSEDSSDDEQYESNTEEGNGRKLLLPSTTTCIMPDVYRYEWRGCNHDCITKYYICRWYEWN